MNQSAPTAGAAQSATGAARVPVRARGPGKPFRAGQSGNPSGQPSLFQVYAAEFGEMTPVEKVELRRAVNLLRRAERADDNNAVRMTREAREWLDGIRARRAHQRERSPVTAFDEYHLAQQSTGK
jgi:hypothetical protein